MKTEYNVEIIRENLSYQHMRWIGNEGIDPKSIKLSLDSKLLQDFKGNYLILFDNMWNIKGAMDRNPNLILKEVNNN